MCQAPSNYPNNTPNACMVSYHPCLHVQTGLLGHFAHFCLRIAHKNLAGVFIRHRFGRNSAPRRRFGKRRVPRRPRGPGWARSRFSMPILHFPICVLTQKVSGSEVQSFQKCSDRSVSFKSARAELFSFIRCGLIYCH
jgi:hypothetical protein